MALSAKIGITKTTETLSRLTCSINFMAHVSAQTRQMLNAKCRGRNAIIHCEHTLARIKTEMDNSVQCNIVKIQGGSIESLHSIVIKDLATPEIEESLSSMEELEQ